MSLLNIQKLSMRFGGLTAVCELDLEVPSGAIVSVIGPNGAGKTTVFNAVTGIYDPTAGEIRFEGRRLERPFTWKTIFLCAVVGLFSSAALTLVSLNLNTLWKATIRRGMLDPATPFSYSDAGHELGRYLRADLTIEPRTYRLRVVDWNVMTANGEQTLARAPGKVAALQLRDALDRLMDEDRPIKSLELSPGWQIKIDDAGLATIRRQRAAQHRLVWTTVLAGLAVGAAGAYVVWSRSRRTPDVIAAGGIARTFQNIRLFSSMTVLENVQIGIDRSLGNRVRRLAWLALALFIGGPIFTTLILPSLMRDPPPGLPWGVNLAAWLAAVGLTVAAVVQKRREELESRRRARDILGIVGLDSKGTLLAGGLAYGDQRRLEIARALATQPRLLLLDEPAAGMNPTEAADLIRLVRGIRDRGVTVLLIEHHMNVVMGISDRIAVLDHGVKIAEGTPAEVRCDPRVIEAYLGREE